MAASPRGLNAPLAPAFHVTVPVRVRAPEHVDDLRRCLAALLACDPPPARILVVDDGSPEPVDVPLGVELLRITPSGPAVARNAGAEHLLRRDRARDAEGRGAVRADGADERAGASPAQPDPAEGGGAPDLPSVGRGSLSGRPPARAQAPAGWPGAPILAPILVFVDADIVVPADTFARLAQVFQTHPESAAIWGTVTAAHPHPGVVSRYKNLTHRHFTRCQPAQTRHLTSMLLAIRPEAFSHVGGFDTRWDTVSVEDVELGRELFAAGFDVRIDHGLEAEHRHRFTLVSAVRNDLHKVRRHVATTLARRARGCPSVQVAADGERRQVHYLLGVPLGAGALLALGTGRPLLAIGLAGALVAWERDLWRSLLREGGAALAVASVPLMVLERGVVAVATVAGTVDHLRARTAR